MTIPYQEESNELRRRGESVLPTAGKAIGAAASVAGTAGLSSMIPRALSLLSPYVNPDTAMAGIKKINPRLGQFVKSALKNGFGKDDIKEFLSEKQQDLTSKEGRNIIEQYSPELFSFLKEQVGMGRKPIEAGALAQADKRFQPTINKLSKENNTPWSSIIESVFGQEAKGASSPQQSMNVSEQAPQQGQQGGSGQQALMKILQQIQAQRGQGGRASKS